MEMSSTICFKFNKRLYVLDCGVPHPNLHRLSSRSSPDSYINSSSHTMKLDQLCFWNRPIDMPSLHVYLHGNYQRIPSEYANVAVCTKSLRWQPIAPFNVVCFQGLGLRQAVAHGEKAPHPTSQKGIEPNDWKREMHRFPQIFYRLSSIFTWFSRIFERHKRKVSGDHTK